MGASITGITISSKQVEIATRLTKTEISKDGNKNKKNTKAETEIETDEEGFLPFGKNGGRVKFLEIDAETMGESFKEEAERFDVVWICEALSHIPRQDRFFENSGMVLKKGGVLVIADWFKGEDVEGDNSDINTIEGKNKSNTSFPVFFHLPSFITSIHLLGSFAAMHVPAYTNATLPI